MNYKTRLIIGFLTAIMSVLLMMASFFYSNSISFIIGVIMMLVSIFYIIITMSMQIFVEDKKLDIESLKKQGLTIVECKKCSKSNVLEDKFCIFCGESLGDNNE